MSSSQKIDINDGPSCPEGVDVSLKPSLGMIFDSIDSAFAFYKRYAHVAGFEPRKSGKYKVQGVIKSKYFVCAKEGFKTFKAVGSSVNDGKLKHTRRVPSKRTGCGAKIKLILNDDNKYKVSFFKDYHNHSFVAQDDVHFLASARVISYLQEKAVEDLGRINKGPVQAFNIMMTLCGGFDKTGATKVDFKNFKKDLNLHIKEFDVDMMVKKLMRRKEYLPNFSCEYYIDNDGFLKGLFWADDYAKKNYHCFGDVVSFDATSRRNKYDLMFVPFTGIDNHNCNVTLGAAIIACETADSYRWLLTMFKQAFGHEPPLIVTDQDPEMKRAIEDVFTESRHRLCMWHVMEELTGKVGAKLCSNTDFRTELCKIVWTYSLLPHQFEEKWASIMEAFNLVGHEWLFNVYGIRHSWIPVYYRDQPMSGLMRTSSRSESENHFFGKFCNPRCTLVEFLAHFNSAIECQRREHRKNDHDTRYTHPDILSNLVLENQAAYLLTITRFFDIQDEIQASVYSCMNMRHETIGESSIYYIDDHNQPCTSLFEVTYQKGDTTFSCTCNRFEQFGLLCCHIFHVLRMVKITEFPKQYVSRRWTREVVHSGVSGSCNVNNDDPNRTDDVKRVVGEVSYAVDYCVNKLVTKFDELCNFRDHVKQFFKTVDEVQIIAPRKMRFFFAAFTSFHNHVRDFIIIWIY